MSRSEFMELFVDQLQDIFSAENQLVSALPKVAQAATHQELKEAIQQHLAETKEQVTRLKRIFQLLNVNGSGKTCEAMQGLIQEAEEIIQKYPASAVRDAGLIAAAQRVEHYEIAVYGCLRTFADQLGLDEIAELLQDSLDEEGNADKKLTSIAEGGFFSTGINETATSR